MEHATSAWESRLLQTKLFVPAPRDERIVRQRLDSVLEHGVARPLTLVCAAAGWGKTTLVADWLRRTSRRAAWISLDEDDGDPDRFVGYLLAALRRLSSAFGAEIASVLNAGDMPETKLALVVLLNDVTRFEEDVIVVLDDLHLVEDVRFHEHLSFVIEHAPPNLHLLVISRVDPPLPLSRLRARGCVTEVRASDLRFSPDETRRFFAEAAHLDLDADATEKLQSRTEGWVAGLQLAALSLRGHADATRFIDALAGDDRLVVEYLVSEVLTKMDPQRRELLLQISILRELTPALVDAVTGRSDGRAVLRGLEADNVFVVPLDEQGQTYRFHHLFGALLRQELESTVSADEVRSLHARAREAYEEQGRIDAAFEHAVAAAAWDDAERLLLVQRDRDLLRAGHDALLFRLRRFPPGELERRPALLLQRAWGHLNRREHTAMSGAMAAARESLKAHPSTEVEGELALMDAIALLEAGRLEPARLRFDEAEALLASAGGKLMPLAVTINRAMLEVTADRFDDAFAATERVERNASRATDPFVVAWSKWARALFSMLMGRPLDTIRIMGRVSAELREHFGDHPPSTAGVGFALLAVAHLERGDVDEAGRWCEHAFEVHDPARDPAAGCNLLLTLARIEATRNPAAPAWADALRHGHALLEQLNSSSLDARLRATRVRLSLMPGASTDPTSMVRAWASEPGMRDGTHAAYRGLPLPTYRTGATELLLGRCLSHLGEHDEARSRLSAFVEAAMSAGRALCATEGQLALVELERRAGRTSVAEEHLREAIAQAAPQRLVGPFLEQDARCMRDAGVLALELGAFELGECLLGRPERVTPSVPKEVNASTLETPLSEREVEVLALVAEGLSNAEVGRRLFVAPSTVKKHLEHVYDKLGVRRRTQAIARARGLGVLS